MPKTVANTKSSSRLPFRRDKRKKAVMTMIAVLTHALEFHLSLPVKKQSKDRIEYLRNRIAFWELDLQETNAREQKPQ